MADSFGSSSDLDSSMADVTSSPPSSPPPPTEVDSMADDAALAAREEQALMEAEERRAEKANALEEQRRVAALRRRQKKKAETKAEREQKARELDELLRQSAAFSDILTKKTQVLGRVGSSALDGKALGSHDLHMATQPRCLVGGTMRDYQLEGLTWMLEICLQNMSGILADEMGLGKTVQTISLIALLREQENYLGPHLIVAPLSTLSNWINEFHHWTPSIPVVMYHGTPEQRKMLFRQEIQAHLNKGRPTDQFPVVCTSYEIILRDRADLAKINWEFIIIDEGHRMKNFDSKLFRELQTFRSATRFLITGTPLQNNLKELWSLLNFLMPKIFTDWEAFSSWFDFSDLQNEEGTADFLEDRAKQDLVKKIHLVLQPLLLRRIKADVASYLPKKREYILYAPMTKEQTDLYNTISDKKADTRAFLEKRVADCLTAAEAKRPTETEAKTKTTQTKETTIKTEKTKTNEIKPELSMAIRSSPRAKKMLEATPAKPPPKNAFALLMGKARAVPASPAPPVTPATPATAARTTRSALSRATPTPPVPVTSGHKRKTSPTKDESLSKSSKSSRQSTPSRSVAVPAGDRLRDSRSSSLSRLGRQQASYREAEASEEDEMSDNEFEAALRDEFGERDRRAGEAEAGGEKAAATVAERAKREMANKKLGNPLMQLRLVCNSPHNFYSPWPADGGGVDESIVTASGKMLLLDRLLPALLARGHKVLIFSQFKTQLDLLEMYCADLRAWPVCRIDGSVAHSDRQAQIDLFNREETETRGRATRGQRDKKEKREKKEEERCRIFLLSTRAGGQGINLASADTVILFDSDWNPQQDLQAQDRAHRIGQKRPVVVYRLATKGTVEEDLLLSADAKRRLEKLVIKKGGFRTMGQKMGQAAGHEGGLDDGDGDNGDDNHLDQDTLKSLLLKDGEVYAFSGGQQVLSDHDLDVLCDRSDEAYARAASGQGDADAFRVIETGAHGITESFKKQ